MRPVHTQPTYNYSSKSSCLPSACLTSPSTPFPHGKSIESLPVLYLLNRQQAEALGIVSSVLGILDGAITFTQRIQEVLDYRKELPKSVLRLRREIRSMEDILRQVRDQGLLNPGSTGFRHDLETIEDELKTLHELVSSMRTPRCLFRQLFRMSKEAKELASIKDRLMSSKSNLQLRMQLKVLGPVEGGSISVPSPQTPSLAEPSPG